MSQVDLLDFKKNVHSQNGEDGVLSEVFRRIGVSSKGTFFEFGAADGPWFSNTWRLLSMCDWKGLYVEQSDQYYEKLVNNCQPYKPRVHHEKGFVEKSGNMSIESLWERACSKLGVEEGKLDFLSIDIDGYDDEMLESLTSLQPKVIMIEVNAGHHPLYPHRIDREIAKNNIGQSMYIMLNLANKNEQLYFPIAYTGNLIMVHRDYIDKFNDVCTDLKELYISFLKHLDTNARTHLKRTFVDKNGLYNGFHFVNDVLTKELMCM